MKITWFGHSCFMVETAEGSAVFDPYSPGYIPGISMPELTADAVICSHGHGDHNYAQGVRLTGNRPSFGVTQISTFHDEAGGKKRGMNTVTVIEAEGIRLAHLGDLGHRLSAEQIKAMGHIDVLLLPVGGFYTIDAQTAKKVADDLAAALVIPMHYSGSSFGFNEIAPVENYVKLTDNAEYAEVNFVEVSAPVTRKTLVLRYPAE